MYFGSTRLVIRRHFVRMDPYPRRVHFATAFSWSTDLFCVWNIGWQKQWNPRRNSWIYYQSVLQWRYTSRSRHGDCLSQRAKLQNTCPTASTEGENGWSLGMGQHLRPNICLGRKMEGWVKKVKISDRWRNLPLPFPRHWVKPTSDSVFFQSDMGFCYSYDYCKTGKFVFVMLGFFNSAIGWYGDHFYWIFTAYLASFQSASCWP